MAFSKNHSVLVALIVETTVVTVLKIVFVMVALTVVTVVNVERLVKVDSKVLVTGCPISVLVVNTKVVVEVVGTTRTDVEMVFDVEEENMA